MSALDQILASVSRLTGARVLCVGRGRFSGPGDGALLLHRVETNAWELPSADDVDAADAVAFGGHLFASCEQFEPAPTKRHDGFMWLDPIFALTCAALPPSAAAALKRFSDIATRGESHKGDDNMDSPRSEFTAAQARAQPTYQVFGDSAPAPLQGESLHAYRCRLQKPFQPHSKRFKDSDLSKVGDPLALSLVEDSIYSDAATAFNNGSTVPAGQLRYVTTPDPSGRPITRAVGDISAFMDQFNPPVRHVRKFLTPGR